MNLNLSPETEAWIEAQIQGGNFNSQEDAIDYAVKMTSLREALLAAIADPQRYTVEEVKENLRAHFNMRRKETGLS